MGRFLRISQELVYCFPSYPGLAGVLYLNSKGLGAGRSLQGDQEIRFEVILTRLLGNISDFKERDLLQAGGKGLLDPFGKVTLR